MKGDQAQFLRMMGRLPSRLTAEQVDWVLNCRAHDVPVLVADRLLKPLGNPSPDSGKFFSRAGSIGTGKLAKMTNALNQHWQKKMPPRRTARPTVKPWLLRFDSLS